MLSLGWGKGLGWERGEWRIGTQMGSGRKEGGWGISQVPIGEKDEGVGKEG